MTTKNGPDQRVGLEIEPNGLARHGGEIDRVGGMEMDPNGVWYFGPCGDHGGSIVRGGLDIEPNG